MAIHRTGQKFFFLSPSGESSVRSFFPSDFVFRAVPILKLGPTDLLFSSGDPSRLRDFLTSGPWGFRLELSVQFSSSYFCLHTPWLRLWTLGGRKTSSVFRITLLTSCSLSLFVFCPFVLPFKIALIFPARVLVVYGHPVGTRCRVASCSLEAHLSGPQSFRRRLLLFHRRLRDIRFFLDGSLSSLLHLTSPLSHATCG